MKRTGLMTLAFFLATQVFFMGRSFAQPTDPKLESFSYQAMNKIKNADFEHLFSDFYLPKGYTKKDTQNDKEVITAGLKDLIQNKTGMPERFLRVDSVAERSITVRIGAGSPQTTGVLPSTILSYKVTFAKFGNGYINIGVYKEGEKLFIKNIGVRLPSSNPKSLEIAQDSVRFMMNIVAEQQKRSPLSAPK